MNFLKKNYIRYTLTKKTFLFMRTYKYRLNPTEEQKVLIKKHLGCCRFVWNTYLEERIKAYEKDKIILTYYDNAKALTQLKKEFTWLKEVNSQSLQATLKNLSVTYDRFFKKISEFPRFKSKKNPKKWFHIPQEIKFKGSKLVIPKFKEWIKVVLHRPLLWTIRNATITKDNTWYYVSLVCESVNESLPKAVNIIWIDLWLKYFCITSNWEKFENPKFLRTKEEKLKKIQSYYSRHKGKRSLRKLQSLHSKIANQRKDFLHKLSTKLIHENQVICLEDLNVKGMMKNHKLAKAIWEVGWWMFVDFLQYKAEWHGRKVVIIDRYFPSSKTCNCCGNIKETLSLNERVWKCSNCWETLDRDINAAKNILNEWLKQLEQ